MIFFEDLLMIFLLLIKFTLSNGLTSENDDCTVNLGIDKWTNFLYDP